MAALVAKYRERYGDVGYSENVLYPGHPRSGRRAATRGYSARRVHVEAARFRRTDPRRCSACASTSSSSAAVRSARRSGGRSKRCSRSGKVSKASLMVGDRAVDVEAAHRNGLHAAGVSVGLRQRRRTRAGASALFVRDRPPICTNWPPALLRCRPLHQENPHERRGIVDQIVRRCRCDVLLRESRHVGDASGAGDRCGAADARGAHVVRRRLQRCRGWIWADARRTGADAAAPRRRPRQRDRQPAQRAPRQHAPHQCGWGSRDPSRRLRCAADVGHRRRGEAGVGVDPHRHVVDDSGREGSRRRARRDGGEPESDRQRRHVDRAGRLRVGRGSLLHRKVRSAPVRGRACRTT